MVLSDPSAVIGCLINAGEWLGEAHKHAGETAGDRVNLIGSTRDLIFGLNSAVDALKQMIQESLAVSSGVDSE